MKQLIEIFKENLDDVGFDQGPFDDIAEMLDDVEYKMVKLNVDPEWIIGYRSLKRDITNLREEFEELMRNHGMEV